MQRNTLLPTITVTVKVGDEAECIEDMARYGLRFLSQSEPTLISDWDCGEQRIIIAAARHITFEVRP